MKTLYNKSEILKKAWYNVKSKGIDFKTALSESWRNAKIKALYNLNEIIRVSNDSEKVKTALSLKSKISIEPIVKRTNLVLDSESVRLFYAK